MMKEFEKYENIPQVLKANGFATLEEARDLCLANGIDVEKTVKDIQPICFDRDRKSTRLNSSHLR